jgi:hypothetical protein
MEKTFVTLEAEQNSTCAVKYAATHQTSASLWVRPAGAAHVVLEAKRTSGSKAYVEKDAAVAATTNHSTGETIAFL